MKKLFTSITLGMLFVALCFSAHQQFSMFSLASGSSALPVGDAEYANGTIGFAGSPCLVWYDWVNVSGTQVISYVLYTNSDYPYPTPVANLVGQHFRSTDGTEVFVASALDKLEVYVDKNGDGIPQANFTSGESEILYYMYINMSDSYTAIPIQKTMEGDVAHYQWGFTYANVYAYLQNATARYGVVAKLTFDHITIGYDFSVSGNVSDLKSSFDIGKVASLDILDSSPLSLEGLSLALLYATSTYASEPYSTYVNDQPYNSTTANDSAVSAEVARVAVGDVKAYDFVFGGSYTVNRVEYNQTRQANLETYETEAEAAALSSVPVETYGPVVWQTSLFRDQLELSDLFGGSWPDVSLNYNTSSLIYRICFPVWDGLQIQHDPVYVGYLFSNAEIPEIPATVILPLIFIAAASLVLMLAKRRKLDSTAAK